MKSIFSGRVAFWMVGALISGLAIAGAEMGFAMLVKGLVDFLNSKNPGDLIFYGYKISSQQILLLFLVFGFARFILSFIASQSGAYVQELVALKLRETAFRKISLQTDEYSNSGKYLSMFSENFPKAAVCCNQLVQLFSTAVTLLFLGVFLLGKYTSLSLIGLCVLLAFGSINIFLNKKIVKTSTVIPEYHQHLMSRVLQTISNLHYLKAVGNLKNFVSEGIRASLSYSSSVIETSYLANLNAGLPAFLGTVVLVILLQVYFSFRTISGSEFMAFMYLFLRLVQILGQCVMFVGNLNTNLPNLFLVNSQFKDFEQVDSKDLSFFGKLKLHDSRLDRIPLSAEGISAPDLRIKDLHFKYKSRSNSTLEDLNFYLPSGGQLGVVGKSGSGKSTLLSLILGIESANSGEVLIGGLPAIEYCQQKSGRIGYVGAEPSLIEDSLRANFHFGHQWSLRDEDIMTALQMVSLGEWFRQLPNGLNTKIGLGGEGLSTGQKQRLCLARALVVKPELLVLDEVSANLDEKTEIEIANVVVALKQKATVIIVSHKYKIIEAADLTITL